MAVTFSVTNRKVYSIGDRKEVIADVTCTGSPTVGGDALTPSALGLAGELDCVDICGGASNSGGTSGVTVGVVHGAGVALSQVLVVFYVQGTAGAANAMVAYTGATAGFQFRVRAVGKGSAA